MDAPPDPTVALRRELDRLRAENARLTRLLGLRAGQTDPAPAQAAAPKAGFTLFDDMESDEE